MPGLQAKPDENARAKWEEIWLSTKFCHIDRYRDAVSIEVRNALHGKRAETAVAISLAVRFAQSPRGQAKQLARARSGTPFLEVLCSHKRSKAYRQTGITTSNLARVVNAAQATVQIQGCVTRQVLLRSGLVLLLRLGSEKPSC